MYLIGQIVVGFVIGELIIWGIKSLAYWHDEKKANKMHWDEKSGKVIG